MAARTRPKTEPTALAKITKVDSVAVDDEPYTDEQRAEDARARADVGAGKGASTTALRRRLGL